MRKDGNTGASRDRQALLLKVVTLLTKHEIAWECLN